MPGGDSLAGHWRRLLAVVSVLAFVVAATLAVTGAAARAAGPPVVDAQFVEGVGYANATLNAEINPEEAATTYQFEYGADASYGHLVPAQPATVGSGAQDVLVSQPLTGLQAGAAYHYRVVASSGEGTAFGQDMVLHTFAFSEPAADTCANAEIRSTQFSAFLPECRAYEQVSPPDTVKAGANVAADPGRTQSSIDGNAIKYYTLAAFGETAGSEMPGAEYVAQRGSDGWVSHSITPKQASIPFSLTQTTRYEGMSPDLSKGVFYAFTPVVPGHPNVERLPNLYLRNDVLTAALGEYDLLSDAYEPVAPRPLLTTAKEIGFAAASTDFSHILFETNRDLTPETAGLSTQRPKAYEWDEGVLRLAGILPDGQPAEDSVAGRGVGGAGETDEGNQITQYYANNTVSADGSRAIFTSGKLTGLHPGAENAGSGVAANLYMRINHSETIQLNLSERAEPDPNGPQPAEFSAATPDDSKVFFRSTEALTDAAPVGVGANLYMYDIDRPQGKRLTLISVDSLTPTTGFDFAQGVVGLSRDGSYVYFLGRKDLLPGLPPSAERLYLWHNGTVSYVAAHDEHHAFTVGREWGEEPVQGGDTFRTSDDGRTIAFESEDPENARRVGYDNTKGTGRGRCEGTRATAAGTNVCYEVYTYSVDSNKLTCVSCNLTGERAESDGDLLDYRDTLNLIHAQALNHPLSSDGRYVFFSTGEALVPQDTNGQRDVYEYDTLTSTLHLLSSGTCGCGSYFVDASPDGSNVFFTTRQQLVHSDIDTSSDLYDARSGGGIASQNVPPPTPCRGEECQGPIPSPPVFSLPASSTFAGVGNPAAPSAVHKPKKPVKHKTKKRKRRHKHASKRGRHSSRRAGR